MDLKRQLGLFPAVALVIGSIVGSGIFATPAGMARGLQSAPLLLLVWIVAGAVSLFGALSQSELAGQMPRTGGLYEYFREIYGERVGYLFGWSMFMIAGSGAIAALAYIFAFYLGEFVALPHLSAELEKTPFHLPLLGDIFPLADLGVKGIAAAAIIVLTWINIRGIRLGAKLQSISTTAKTLAILGIVALAFALGPSGGAAHWLASAGARPYGWQLASALTFAMAGAFWSYSGWGALTAIAGEVREPARTIPRAIILGTAACIVLYLATNLAYLYILPVSEMGAAPQDRVASSMMARLLGSPGARFVAILVMVSTFDNANSTILTLARIYFAMAREKLFFRSAATVHPKYQTPHGALLFQAAWALVLLFSGSFDVITSVFVFVNWLFYALIGAGVFIMRKRHPDRARPFKVPGFPFVPAAFSAFAAAYTLITLAADVHAFASGTQPFLKTVAGLVLVLAGLPFLAYFKAAYTR